jgi:hypothetical protein
MDLEFLGFQLKRAYPYIGSFSSFFYYPFFLLAPNILTQRLLGIFFLVIFVTVLMLLEEENKLSVAVIFFLSFPIIYQLINDTGPVRYGLFMIVFTPLLAKLIVKITQKYIKISINILLGFLLFLAVEDKPSFLYFIPSVVLLTIAYNYEENASRRVINSIRSLMKKIRLSLITFASLTLLYLLVAKTSSGQPYFFELMGRKELEPQAFTDALASLLSFLTNFQKFSHRVYDHKNFRLLNISFSLLIWCYGFFILGKLYKKRIALLTLSKILFTLLAFISSITVLLFMRNGSSGHHFIYPYTFILLIACQSMAYVTEQKNRFLILYSFFSLILATQLLLLVPKPESSWERYNIFEYLKQEKIAKNYIIAHLNWGTYYIASLYGHKDQLSLHIKTLDALTAMEIINLLDKVQRKIACICHGPNCNSEYLFNSFLKKIEFEEVDLPNTDWKVYLERSRI